MDRGYTAALCPCCGSKWDPTAPKAAAARILFPLHARVSPQRSRLLKHFIETFEEWTPRHKLADVIAANMPVAIVQMSNLRRNVEPYGFVIETRRHYGSRLKRTETSKI